MVKIGVIIMPFSNPTCHFRATADFTHGKSGLRAFHTTVYILSSVFVQFYSRECFWNNLYLGHIMVKIAGAGY